MQTRKLGTLEVSAIGIACLSFHFFERPFIRKGRSIIDRWKQQKVASSL